MSRICLNRWPQVVATWLIAMSGGLIFSHTVSAENVQTLAQCEALSRPAIDCSCVARRMEQFLAALPAGTSTAVIVEGYRAALGGASDQGKALETLYSDPRQAVAVEMALDPLGGVPGSVEDFEAGCVVAGAGKASLPPWPREPATEGYVKGCVASTGEQRYCECSVARARGRVNRDQFEAYFRSFSDYSDRDALSLAEMTSARATAMGVTDDEYQRLVQRGRDLIDSSSEADMNYCGALLWADAREGDPADVVDSRYRQAVPSAGAGGAMVAAAPSSENLADDGASDSRFPQARAIVADSCSASGEGAEFCSCLLAAVEGQVFPKVDSESVALAYALINFSEGMNPMDMMQMMSQLSSDDQMAAAMLSGSTDPAGACY